jgi:hypothetical protein
MISLDNTSDKVSKVSHAIGFKTLTYPKGFTLKMKEWNSLDAELVPHDERQQPKQWSGPQDGLPPVNTECEVETDYGVWEHGIILCHGYDDFKPHAVAQCASGLWMEEVNGFRAIRTPEQLAAELRETAIREFMDVVGTDCRVTAGKAVDAGFKR